MVTARAEVGEGSMKTAKCSAFIDLEPKYLILSRSSQSFCNFRLHKLKYSGYGTI